MRTLQWRYTLWLRWDGASLTPRWDDENVGEELYDHGTDAGDDTDGFENVNLATSSEHSALKSQLREQLKMGWKAALPTQTGRSHFNVEFI